MNDSPPTQSDARWEAPEWLVEKMARGVATKLEYLPTKKLILSDFARVETALLAALSECPVLGLTKEEVDALDLLAQEIFNRMDARLSLSDDGRALKSAKAKLLATREALERGSDG